MDDIARWLGQQLDEDERIAQAAPRGPWSAEVSGSIVAGDGGRMVPSVGGAQDGQPIRWREVPAVEHILAHDPARVLREIDAKRRTLIRCQEALLSPSPMLVHFAKQTVREMAIGYSYRPGYAEALAVFE